MKCQICSCKMERDPTRNMDRCYDLCDDGKVYDRKYLYRISNPITKFSPYIWCSSFADPKGTCKSIVKLNELKRSEMPTLITSGKMNHQMMMMILTQWSPQAQLHRTRPRRKTIVVVLGVESEFGV